MPNDVAIQQKQLLPTAGIVWPEKVQHRQLITSCQAACQEVKEGLCEGRAQGAHGGVTGEGSGKTHDRVANCDDVTSVATGDRF